MDLGRERGSLVIRFETTSFVQPRRATLVRRKAREGKVRVAVYWSQSEVRVGERRCWGTWALLLGEQ